MAGNHFRSRPDTPAPQGRRRRGAGPVRLLFGAFLFIAGAALFLYPTLDAWCSQQRANELIATVLDTPATNDEAPAKASKDDAAYRYLAAYNARVAAGEAGAINDPWNADAYNAALEEVGLADGLVGSVSIPRMDIAIPLYLGASEEHLVLGAAVISGTSAPLGGDDTNCVIAAHRGTSFGQPMFRDIESLQMGDPIIIETPWDTLTYRVVQTQVITPDDTDAVGVRVGRDLVTLVTCHPYGHNYQRYLVVAERSDEPSLQQGSTSLLQALASSATRVIERTDSPLLLAERVLRIVGLMIMAAVAAYTVRACVRPLAQRGKGDPR